MDSALQMSIDKADLLTWTKAKKLEEIFSFREFGSIKGDHRTACRTFYVSVYDKNHGEYICKPEIIHAEDQNMI